MIFKSEINKFDKKINLKIKLDIKKKSYFYIYYSYYYFYISIENLNKIISIAEYGLFEIDYSEFFE
jgi:hypothetical protein